MDMIITKLQNIQSKVLKFLYAKKFQPCKLVRLKKSKGFIFISKTTTDNGIGISQIAVKYFIIFQRKYVWLLKRQSMHVDCTS